MREFRPRKMKRVRKVCAYCGRASMVYPHTKYCRKPDASGLDLMFCDGLLAKPGKDKGADAQR